MPKKCEHCGKRLKGGQRFCSQRCNNAARPNRHPWETWFSRRSFKVRPQDYSCRQYSMVNQIRNRAVALGVKVSVRSDEDGTIHVQVKS